MLEVADTRPADVLAAVRQTLAGQMPPVALHEPEFGGRELEYVSDCIETGWVSSVGSYVDRFERDLAAFTGVPHVVATCNGTSALHVCLLLAGVRPGEEVLMPALTFIATANAVSYAGAVPHFVDSEVVSLGVHPERLEEHLRESAQVVSGQCINRNSGRTIRALVVMHAFGHPANLEALDVVARRWNVALIEDAAESLGSWYQGRHTGSFGVVSALSFNGNKVVTTGGGGAVMTRDPALGRRAKHLTTTARVPHRWSFMHDEVGYNYRLPNLNAALGCAQLEQLPAMLQRKRRLAARYDEAFSKVKGVRFLREPEGTKSNYWLNTIVIDEVDATIRDEILTTLNDGGFQARPVWTLMHRLPMYERCPRADLSTSERLEASLVNLPSSARLVSG